MENKYPLASSTWGNEEHFAIERVLKNQRTTMGVEVAKFELEFAKYCGTEFAVMVNSGSSANLLAIAALFYKSGLKLKAGMEVIVPAVSWATTYYPLHQYGLKLRFVDVDLDTLCMKPDDVLKAINENTGAVLAVNLLGQPAALPEISKICEEKKIYLIEDNCESMGASIEDKLCGTWGIVGTFSTFFSHHINTMEGGVVVTDDQEIYEILKSLRAHGWTRELTERSSLFVKSGEDWDDQFRFILPGYNVRPLEMAGAIGREQLLKLPNFVKVRQENHAIYMEEFGSIPNIRVQSGPGKTSSFGFSLILENEVSNLRKELVMHLQNEGIESRPIVTGNFLRQPVIAQLNVLAPDSYTNADIVHDSGLFIGNHHYNLREEIGMAAQVVKNFVKGQI